MLKYNSLDEVLLAAVKCDITPDALDLLYDEIDERLLEKRFEEVDGWIKTLDPTPMSNVIALGILTITFMWRKLLPSRATFYNKVKEKFSNKDGKVYAEKMLKGLE